MVDVQQNVELQLQQKQKKIFQIYKGSMVVEMVSLSPDTSRIPWSSS